MKKQIGRKILALLLCVAMMGAILTIERHRRIEAKERAVQASVEQEEIEQLEKQREMLLRSLPADVAIEEKKQLEPEATLCIRNISDEFYQDCYGDIQKKELNGIIVLSNGILPGDYHMISVQHFVNMIQDGWVYAISMDEETENSSDWEDILADYLYQLNERVDVAPVGYMESGTLAQDQVDKMKEQGLTLLLTHQNNVDRQNVLNLLSYQEPQLLSELSKQNGLYAVEIDCRNDGNYSLDSVKKFMRKNGSVLRSYHQLRPVEAEELDEEKNETNEEEILESIKAIDLEIRRLYGYH